MIYLMGPRVKVLSSVLFAGALLLQGRPVLAQDATSDNGWFNGAPAPQQPAPQQGAPQQQVPQGAPEANAPGPDETDPRALTEFHSQLEPYGSWVEDPKYGTIWVPNREQVGSDFAPYVSSGHWALAEDGDWVWVSDYPFGDIVFHYGRWVWIADSGWAWVPGYRYANAWVVWRVPTDDYAYVGWAPMPPTWGWYGGFAVGWGWYAPVPFVFCPSAYVFSYRVHTYIVHDRYRINEIAGHTARYGGYGGGYGGHTPATPHVMPANAAPVRGPSLQRARVPSSAVPESRVPSTHAAYTSAERSGAFTGAGYRGYSSGARPSSSAGVNGAMRPRSYSSSPNGGYAPPSARYVAPSTRYGSYAPGRSAPYAAPRAVAPSQRYTAPAPHYSAPAPHYSAPAPHYSAPAPHYSAPARSGGGSFRGGGGSFRGGGGGHGRR